MGRSEPWRWLGLLLACLALASCAAIGGLGDFQEVACVGLCGGDGGGLDGEAADAATTPDAGQSAFGTVGGTVTGLKGSGLVLKNNGGDDLPIAADGSFKFPTPVRTGDPYAVTVSSQPSNPTQTCSITSGSGTVQGADVTDVKVTCATAAYSVGGIVVGLAGTGLVLTNNGGDDLAVAANGSFTFPVKIASGATFSVAVKTQPSPSGPCTVSGGTGTVGVGDVTGVVVNCAPGTYTVGGTVSGLNGTLVLQNNGGSNLTITSNGGFAFAQTLATGSPYAVTVLTQPGYPPRSQTCTVTSGSGSVGSTNVTSVSVACVTNAFTIGGSVSGLSGSVVLKNNGGDALTVNASGAFTFATPVLSGNTYAVTVGTQPSGQTCSVTSGSGTVTSGNVTNVAVGCTGGSASDPGILCGATHCNPASQLCCVTNGVPACATKCTGAGTVSYTCDDAQDCATAGTPGLVCCGSVNGTTVNAIYCTQASLCTSPKAFYCDPGVSNPCPNGGTCTATNAPSGFYRCF